MEKTKTNLILFSLFFILLGFAPTAAQAANLYFSPSAGSYSVDSNISLRIFVSSASKAMNAASGVISFPQDKLRVVSLSKSGSIISLWVQEPSFSNSAGTVSFEGIVLNPGFTGAAGKIITVNFKAKAAGSAPLAFSSGSILANDGKGTNILTNLGSANFAINLQPVKEKPAKSTTPAPIIGTPLSPQIVSKTHPSPNEWYANNNPEFNWQMPASVTGVNILANQNPNSNPGTISDGLFSSYKYNDVKDEIWYFHIRLRNNNGWGAITHFRFQIDTEKPNHFEITENKRDDLTEPRVKFIFDAKDETSGIDYYEVQIDNENSQIWQDNESHIYETPVLGPGEHTLIVKAVDKANNSLANSAEFVIETIDLPIITECSKELRSKEILIARGTTYPNVQVVVWLQKEKDDPKTQIIQSDKDGNFIFIAEEKLNNGIYKLWAEIIDERGARSNATDKLTIAVEQPEILKIGSQVVGFLSVIIPLIALIFLLIFLLLFGWRKFSSMKRKVKKEVREAEQALRTAFDLLREDIGDQIKLLEKVKSKQKFTEEERKIIRQIKKNLNDAEKFVRKEIKDIKKEIK